MQNHILVHSCVGCDASVRCSPSAARADLMSLPPKAQNMRSLPFAITLRICYFPCSTLST